VRLRPGGRVQREERFYGYLSLAETNSIDSLSMRLARKLASKASLVRCPNRISHLRSFKPTNYLTSLMGAGRSLRRKPIAAGSLALNDRKHVGTSILPIFLD
jgi:hypothetical protein